MSNRYFLPHPEHFDFRHAVGGHGWYDLAPFEFDEAGGGLRYVFRSRKSGRPESILIEDTGRRISIRCSSEKAGKNEAVRVVRHVLRMDEDLADFYGTLRGHEPLSWVEGMKAGRLLRSATVFEDLVKTLCTTNCSWSMTRIMTTNLVDKLGEPAADGRKAFPTPEAIASQDEAFFRNEIKAGYRAPFFIEMAASVASGKVDPESWLVSDLPTPELKKEMKSLKGVGEYAADNLLKLIGRYDGLALDSWLRAGFYKKHNMEKACPDGKIEKHYRKFGKWKGLAIWCDMTRHWFEGGRQSG